MVGMIIGGVILIFVIAVVSEMAKTKDMTPAQKANHTNTVFHGPLNGQIICQQCQTKGHVHTKTVEQKSGISGGKATGAILTGGISLLATGLSRKNTVTQAHCANCKSSWVF
jgi:RecJ-like exonuclease